MVLHPPVAIPLHATADYVVGGAAVGVVDETACLYSMTAELPAARIVGTSAGGYAAAAVCMRVLPEKVQRTFGKLLVKNRALDGSFFHLLKHFGYARGDQLRQAAFDLVGDVTLGETYIPMGCYVCDHNEPEAGPLLLSSWTTPDVLVVDAVCAGGAIPLGIKPQHIPSYIRGNRLFSDGGAGRNFPLDALDDHPHRMTVGIRMAPEKPDAAKNPVRPGDWKAYGKSLVKMLMWASNNAHNTSKSKHVIVDVPQIGDSLDFSQTPEQLEARWHNGVTAGRKGLIEARKMLAR
jgi:predicted acylesterase/phospholipase RssA